MQMTVLLGKDADKMLNVVTTLSIILCIFTIRFFPYKCEMFPDDWLALASKLMTGCGEVGDVFLEHFSYLLGSLNKIK